MIKFKDRINSVALCGLDIADTEVWLRKWMELGSSAKKKGNKRLLTFDEYLLLAVKAGLTKPSQIGTRIDSYQMGRIGDTGDYEIGNCRFITKAQNLEERKLNGGNASISNKMLGRSRSEEVRRKISETQKGRIITPESIIKMKETIRKKRETAHLDNI